MTGHGGADCEDAGDPREQISRLEVRIEELAEAAEGCRKIILISKAAIAAGAILGLVIMLGAIRFEPMALIGAIAAVIGGTVLLGSNSSTLAEMTAAMKTAETQRAELIDRIELRLVGDRDAGSTRHPI
jgi:hypothetical protein